MDTQAVECRVIVDLRLIGIVKSIGNRAGEARPVDHAQSSLSTCRPWYITAAGRDWQTRDTGSRRWWKQLGMINTKLLS